MVNGLLDDGPMRSSRTPGRWPAVCSSRPASRAVFPLQSFPSVILLVRKVEHLAILVGIAVRGDARVLREVISLADSLNLLRAGAVASYVSAGEPAAFLFELRANHLHAHRFAPRVQVRIE